MGILEDAARGIEGRAREFYEFVMPPADVIEEEGGIRVLVDMPGFERERISLSLHGRVLRVRAERDVPEGAVTSQRPARLDKEVRLPPGGSLDEDAIGSARYADGVLDLLLPVSDDARQIPVG
ncbi:MAG: Hsp20/alpha crystallin family protein [Nitrosopumilus sp.]|nr:Hsp20/alpha crystallin family protein [Nitrosopumilus sp.]CAI9831080.1 Molecular chaperone [Nitrosopumilaceae archaeon]MDA7941173.1 Hsp20/alpha crystallin family protein [Nitrosopumilus sp.]MDA7942429.1 Hsp20/alpha crystallin family protein [Nitrosopumilus sp.]MDA7944850.1 Hsp20/alpha crystallin family protein [Nitrosopumilus sp.]